MASRMFFITRSQHWLGLDGMVWDGASTESPASAAQRLCLPD